MKTLLGAIALLLVARRARARRRAAADALLAADRLRALRAQVDDGAAQAGRQAGAGRARLRARLQEQALVDSKDPDAKPLPVAKMMVHHFLYFTAGPRPAWTRTGASAATSSAAAARSTRAGASTSLTPPDFRARYGIHNATPDGRAPAWSLTAMVMNHYKRAKRFYVRTRIWYTTEPRTPIYPIAVGDCRHLLNGMAYDVPGGGAAGLDVRRSLDLDRAVQRAHRRRRLTSPRRRDQPHADEPDVRPHAVRRQGLLRRRRPPVQHDPADPARAGADRERHVPLARGRPDRRGRDARARRGARQRDAARGRHGLLGAAARARRRRDRLRADAG